MTPDKVRTTNGQVTIRAGQERQHGLCEEEAVEATMFKCEDDCAYINRGFEVTSPRVRSLPDLDDVASKAK